MYQQQRQDTKPKALPPLGFTEALNEAVNKVVTFEGRSRRSEFWWAMLVLAAAVLVVAPLVGALVIPLAGVYLTPFVGLVVSLVAVPLVFRRLHDTGRSGWWWGGGAIMQVVSWLVLGVLAARAGDSIWYDHDYDPGLWMLAVVYVIMAVAVVVYHIVVLVFLCQDSEPEENDYGPSPKYPAEDNTEPVAEGE